MENVPFLSYVMDIIGHFTLRTFLIFPAHSLDALIAVACLLAAASVRCPPPSTGVPARFLTKEPSDSITRYLPFLKLTDAGIEPLLNVVLVNSKIRVSIIDDDRLSPVLVVITLLEIAWPFETEPIDHLGL